MAGAKRKSTTKLIRTKNKMAMISLCLTILVMLITLSIYLGFMKKEDWMFWGG